MNVTAEDKAAVLKLIVDDVENGMFPEWDGTFGGLQSLCDANEYLLAIWDGYGETFEDKCLACNEVIAHLEATFAVRFPSLRGKVSS